MTARPVRGWIVLPATGAALLLVPVPAGVVDRFYSRGIYPWIQGVLTLLSNLVPFAVLDALIVTAALLAIARLLWLVRVGRSRGVRLAVWEGARRLVRAVSIVVVCFVTTWGCNYRRVPLEAALGAPPPPTTAVLRDAVIDAGALAARLRPGLGADADITYKEIAQRLPAAMREALGVLQRRPDFRPGRPKHTLLRPYFTWAGITGMVNPLALESIVQPDLLPAERAFVLAHEWAHLAGQADEAEASAVGWLACMRGGPALAYSASLYLILEGVAGLPPAAQSDALASLDAGVRADLAAIVARIRRQHPQVQRVASAVYDEYLRANRVDDGTASYARALTLILSAPLRDELDRY